ncbi:MULTISPECIES: efflux RND transporter periplasmic adaptor subunit [Maricaulis]|jgi:RND family efflux transporter MFP subunit|uniref:efflux RND transporter periplasmic adaptor subunit n=1 Tax=Maricaulis TaxID=74317 RepID=UPI000C54BA21|nr:MULTISPECIES: efflux RND transporter periplasmic adaptor subunit [Maricaulis]MAC88239.1 efflux transporter periplasmic adaptor subunit [Maricaulis sp.]
MGSFLGRFIILAVVGVVGVGIIVMLFGTQAEPERANAAPRPVAVFVDQARLDSIALQVSSQGEARPRTQITLVPQVAGRITFVNPDFIEGGFFEAGETLVQIDDADYRLAVTRASAQVAQAQQALTREQAESELAASEWAELGDGEASSLTLREPQLAEARAQLAAANATLQSARLDLQRTRISAPFSGRVRAKNADLGQYVSPGTQLGTVFSTDAILVRLPLTDHELGLLGIPIAYNAADGEGMPVELSATLAGRAQTWQGRITRTDSAIDPQTRVLYAIAEVADPYGAGAQDGAPLAVGLFVTANITGRDVENAYILPRSALRGQNSVYVAEEGGTLSVRTVEVIDSTAERVVVSSGVLGGEMVITSPIRGASDGMRIQTFDESGEIIAAYSATYDEDPAEGLAETDTDGADSEAVASNG